MRLSITEFLRRLSGISTPIFGISWTPPSEERQLVNGLLQQLGDRRLIRKYHGGFEYRAVIVSLEKMRSDATQALSQLSPEAACRPTIENLRTALHLFQTLVESERPAGRDEASPTDATLKALGVFQDTVGSQLRSLARAYSIPLYEGLVENFQIRQSEEA